MEANDLENNDSTPKEDLSEVSDGTNQPESTNEEKELLVAYVEELNGKISKRAELRARNSLATKERPELDTSKLDSSLKKNTAFIKKVRNITESQHSSLEKELLSLNLTKYISELAQSIVDTRMKMSDIGTAVHICSLLHQRYQEFSPLLLSCFQKLLSWKKDEKPSNISKLRVDIRLYAELISAGVFTQKDGLRVLGNSLTTIVNADKEEHQSVSVILSFCRHCGHDYIGITPRKIRLLAENFKIDIPTSDFLPRERQKNVGSLMKEYFLSLTNHLIKEHKELNKIERQNLKILQTRGELTEERKSFSQNMSSSLSKLLSNASQLADLLDEELPTMPVLKASDEIEAADEFTITDSEKFEIASNEQNLWDDEDSKAFYTSFPDLKALLPSILYAESEQVPSTSVDETTVSESDINEEILEENLEESEEMEDLSGKDDDQLPIEEVLAEEEAEDSGSGPSSSNKILFDGFLNTLPNCISRDLVDSAAFEFCLKFNTKHFRKKLVKALFLVPRIRLDLLSFYSRFVAILRPLMPEVASDLNYLLKQDFKYQVKKKDQINIETKIKVVRFIGELTKFGVFSLSETLLCLRLLLNDFRHHHIEMVCNLLETCGRFLFRSAESHHRTKVILEQIMRKKTVSSFDPRYDTMIENAYYYVNPPEVSSDRTTPELSPMFKYIQFLMYASLNKSNTERILRQIRKLHWEDEEVSSFAVLCLSSPWKAKYYNIRCLANLLAGLTLYYDWVGTVVVDNILEYIRMGMEVNDAKYNQLRVACVKYLGELYNYRVIESLVIFKVLYSLITFGVNWDPNSPSEFDPPDHLLRIRLASSLLDTCGQYFYSGSSKKRLECYLTYFQHYYLYKKMFYPHDDFPWQVDHMVHDSITALRPKFRLYKGLVEAQEAVVKLNKNIFDKAVETLPILKQYVEELDTSSAHLPPILEDEVNTNDVDTAESIKHNEFVDIDIDEEEEEEEEEIERGSIRLKRTGEEIDGWVEEGVCEGSLTPSQHSQPSRDIGEGQENEDLSGGRSGEYAEEKSPKDGTGMEATEEDPSLSIHLEHFNCAEDDDFMSEFDRMLADNLLERTREPARSSSTQASSISVPLHIKSSAKKTYEQIISEGASNEKSVMNFVLLTRSGNKQQCSNVEMPVDSDLVSKLKFREQEERAERDRVKQLTLEINERQEEEEALEMMQQGPKATLHNINRERKPRYQHPKGAPDADLIFGSKKPR